MSLQKVKTLPSGVLFDFHKITKCNFDDATMSAEITVSSFLNEAAKIAKKTPVEETVKSVSIANKSNVIGSAYESLQAGEKVNGAIITEEIVTEIPAVLDEEGKEIESAKINITPAVYEQVETNFFADAVTV